MFGFSSQNKYKNIFGVHFLHGQRFIFFQLYTFAYVYEVGMSTLEEIMVFVSNFVTKA